MPVAKNMTELKKILNKEMRKALQVTAAKAEADMFQETAGFYTQGTPKMYVRTGALGDTPKTTSIIDNGDSLEFEAYLDTSEGYTTGKNPSMHDVLSVANDHGDNHADLRHPLGKQGFWNRAEKKIEQDLNNTMRSFFN